jgi:hypothetical protein
MLYLLKLKLKYIMKRFFILVFVLAILGSCSSDDDANTGQTVSPNFTSDIDAIIALPSGSDISTLVDFGQGIGNSAADFTSEVSLNDTFELKPPTGLASTDEFFYVDIFFTDEFGGEIEAIDLIVGGRLEAVLPEGITGISAEDYYLQDNIPLIALKVIDVDDNDDITWKYSFECEIIRNGVEYGPYFVDPRLKLKSRTN